jgi:7-cyano-7-deazaguanine reductase
MTQEPIEGKLLGKQVGTPQKYSPGLLVAVPRHLNRSQYNIEEEKLPFTGFDAWHAYELGFLTEKGLPVSGVIKFVYPCNNPFLVESKSLKLYLNSFNMERRGRTAAEGVSVVLSQIKEDIEKVLQTQIDIDFFDRAQDGGFDFEGYDILENRIEAENAVYESFNENPNLIGLTGNGGTLKVATHLLRSNCKITHQPDWGSAFIHIKADKLPDADGLLKYLVSFRNENHFHEEICEMIYKRLWDIAKPSELAVTCIYTRRGGIDICPSRASHRELLPQRLGNSKILTGKLLKQ